MASGRSISAMLARALESNPQRLQHEVTMISAFTALEGVSLLHVAAEYGAERDIYGNVQRLLQAAGRRAPPLTNVPNEYLRATDKG
jgi:hypothetical protein